MLPDERLTPFHFIGYQDTFHGRLINNGHSGTVLFVMIAVLLEKEDLKRQRVSVLLGDLNQLQVNWL